MVFMRPFTASTLFWNSARSLADLGTIIGGDVSEREVAYLKATEWVRTPEDVLWRRTKCGLLLGADERTAAERLIERWLT